MEVKKLKLVPELNRVQKLLKPLWRHMYTLWLFTCSDLKAIVVPATIFGMVTALSGPLLTTIASPDYYAIFCRIPLVILSVWMDLLVQDISNQRKPASVVEDAGNKPWRPLPSGRINGEDARRLLIAAILASIIKSFILGGTLETLVLFVLVWIYNDLEGADSHYLIRNLINALGISCFSANAATVATLAVSSTPHYPSVAPSLHSYIITPTLALATPMPPRFYAWLFLLALAIFFTIPAQDLQDMPGDAAKGRPTMPLVAGELVTRWSVAVGAIGASAACCAFWRVGMLGWTTVLGGGGVFAGSCLVRRGVEWDKGTWRLWCVWIGAMYCLPIWM